MHFIGRFSKIHKTFLYMLFSAEGQTDRGTGVMNRNSQFGTPLQMQCISTEDLRNFWPSYRQWSRYHNILCQVNTTTHAVRRLTQIIWVQEAHILYSKSKINHSVMHVSFTYVFLLYRNFETLILEFRKRLSVTTAEVSNTNQPEPSSDLVRSLYF